MLVYDAAPIVPALVPPLRLNIMLAPPVVIGLLCASRADSVKVTVLPDETVMDATLTIDLVAEIIPGLTRMVGKLVATVTPVIVAEMVVGDPDITPVKLAV